MAKQVDFFTVGTGSVHSVPLWGCACAVCQRAIANACFARAPCSGVLHMTDGDTVRHILIDAGDMHIAHRYDRTAVVAGVLTHYHPDHIQGLLSVRWHGGGRIPIMSVHDTQGFGDLYANNGIFDFVFVPPFETFYIQDIAFTPVPLNHSVPTNGYVIEYNNTRLAYLCDTKGLPPETARYLQSLHIHTVVLDCCHSPDKTSNGHGNLTQAQEVYTCLHPKHMVLSHIEHDFDVWMCTHPIPKPLQVARDHQHILSF